MPADTHTAAQPRTDGERVIIQKYANRRLYNKATSSYITLDDLSKMVKDGVDFVVNDAKTGEDITRKVLTQIIFEEEGRGQNLLPVPFLRQLIGFYGDRMQAFLPSYLELSLESFIKQQERMREKFTAVSPTPVHGHVRRAGPPEHGPVRPGDEDVHALRLSRRRTAAGKAGPGLAPPPARDEESLSEIKRQMAAMQEQIAALSKK